MMVQQNRRESFTQSRKGFTLLEIIVVLLLSAVLVATTGLIVTTFVKSYLLAKQSAEVTQKAQVAMKRLKLEFENISDVHTAGPASLYYKIKTDSGAETIRVAGLDGTTVKLGNALPVNSGNTLLDRVNSFSLNYFDENGNLSGSSNWSSTGSWNSQTVSNLYAIRIDFTLVHESGNIPFSSTVYPSFRTGRITGPLNWNSQ